MLKSHAMAYRIYEAEFKAEQGGVVGVTLNTNWNEPATDKPEDIEAAERAMQFSVYIV
jgi:lactase-phlorizin hydrolase